MKTVSRLGWVLPLVACPVLAGSAPFSPVVEELLKIGVEPSRNLLERLEHLAKANHWPAQALSYDSGPTRMGGASVSAFDAGRAVRVDLGGDHFVVVALHGGGLMLPGPDVEQLLLLDARGDLLDKVSCLVSTRYGHVHSTAGPGPQHTVFFRPQGLVPSEPQENGAPPWHTITFRGKSYTFGNTGHAHLEEVTTPSGERVLDRYFAVDLFSEPEMVDGRRSVELERHLELRYRYLKPRASAWARKGLLRVGIENGRFTALFPPLGADDTRVLEQKEFDEDELDELYPYAERMARKIQIAANRLRTDETEFVDVDFDLAPDGSIVKLGNHTYRGENDPAAWTRPFLEAVRAAAPFGPTPVEVKEPVAVTAHFDRQRFRGGIGRRALEAIDWKSYLEKMERHVERFWRPPKPQRKELGRIEVWVLPDGAISGARDWNPNSWNRPASSAAALQAVVRAAPFPPLPEGVTWPVSFSIAFADDRPGGGGVKATAGCDP